MSRFAAAVNGLPKGVKIVLWVLLALLMFALPLIEPPFIATDETNFGGALATTAIYVLVALGLNIVVGYAGLLDLGYIGFFAIGAYTVAVMGSLHGTTPWLLAVPVAVLVTLTSGVLLGWPTLRVRGDYLAIVTLGFGEIIRLTVLNVDWLGGASGISSIPRPPNTPVVINLPHLNWESGVPKIDLSNTSAFLTFGVEDQVPYYWLALIVIIAVLLFDRLIKESRVGRAWEATREDEDAAELMGVPTFRFKLLAFAMGAFIGGLSGSLFAARQGFINPESFTLIYSILFVAAVVVGGQGNRWGVIIGAICVFYLQERFRFVHEFRVLLFGLALMLLAIFRPQGILPPRRTVRARRADKRQEVLEEGSAHG